jgi:hypothetical protein
MGRYLPQVKVTKFHKISHSEKPGLPSQEADTPSQRLSCAIYPIQLSKNAKTFVSLM